jgi:hypothetical protein
MHDKNGMKEALKEIKEKVDNVTMIKKIKS